MANLGRAILTANDELTRLRETLGDIRHEVHALTEDLRDVRERIVRLEASRDADRSQMAAELSRFKAEVERAELRLSRLLPPGEGKSRK